MKRRKFLLSLGGAVICPFAAFGQQIKVPTIGVLVLGNPDPGPFLKALREALGKIGYIEADVIVAWQTPSAMAAKQATNSIPIIMAAVGDAVATGLVKNLARPEGNITGNTALAAEVMAKNVELIRETLPAARRVAVLANTVDPFSKPFLSQIELAAPALGIEINREVLQKYC
jgi:putative ABC transport system substrate-binding protein